MTKLDQILNLPDKTVRRRELALLAASLGVSSGKALSGAKPVSEEMLVVQIYDALKAREKRLRHNIRFSLIAGGVCAAGVLILVLFRQSFADRAEIKRAQKEFDQEVFEGYNKKGDTILEEESQQPVRFEAMEGVYEQYDDDGYLAYELEYVKGVLRKKKKFDRSGKMVSEILIDEDGKAILVR